jgi:hypothetical protein
MIMKSILIDYLDQISRWKNNLDHPQTLRRRKDCNDRATVQSIQFWLQGYLNGLILIGWIKKEASE